MHFLHTNSSKHPSKSIHHFALPQEALAQYQTRRGRCQNKLYPDTSKFLLPSLHQYCKPYYFTMADPWLCERNVSHPPYFSGPIISFNKICYYLWHILATKVSQYRSFRYAYPIIKSRHLNHKIIFLSSKN